MSCESIHMSLTCFLSSSQLYEDLMVKIVAISFRFLLLTDHSRDLVIVRTIGEKVEVTAGKS